MNRLNDPEHWWSRAEEARALAELMQHPDTKQIMALLRVTSGSRTASRSV
jgi:hypothetical protein